MGDVKMHYGSRLRLDVRYPGKPARGQPEPLPGSPVHYADARLFVACRIRGAGVRLKTQRSDKVTCPACLKLLNFPAHPKQPPCESPAGATGLLADPAVAHAKKPIIIMQSSSLSGSPVPAAAGAGFFIGGEYS